MKHRGHLPMFDRQGLTVMKIAPYFIATLSIIIWAISLFVYHAGPIVHVMLVISLLAALWLEVIQWKKSHRTVKRWPL